MMYVAYACVVRHADGGIEVSFPIGGDGVPQNALERAARFLAVLGRERGYWVIYEAESRRTWIRPYKPRQRPRRFYTDPSTGRVMDES
jgi:hypothetical protein